jgi:hypothetical protein
MPSPDPTRPIAAPRRTTSPPFPRGRVPVHGRRVPISGAKARPAAARRCVTTEGRPR